MPFYMPSPIRVLRATIDNSEMGVGKDLFNIQPGYIPAQAFAIYDPMGETGAFDPNEQIIIYGGSSGNTVFANNTSSKMQTGAAGLIALSFPADYTGGIDDEENLVWSGVIFTGTMGLLTIYCTFIRKPTA